MRSCKLDDIYLFFLLHLVSGSPNDGRKHGSRSIVPGESSLAHSRAIVDHQCSYVVVAHFRILYAEIISQQFSRFSEIYRG